MAGIGFELKKIYRKEGITRGALGAVYSTIVTLGPMIFSICTILILFFFLKIEDVSYAQRELISSTILYAFIFSMIITAPFNVVFSRYIADKFYKEEYSGILNSYYMGISVCAGIASLLFVPVGLSLRIRGNVELSYILASYVLWIALIILFFSIIYLHATKDYKMITLFFVSGSVITLLLGVFLYKRGGMDIKHVVICSLAAGFLITAIQVFAYMKRYFSFSEDSYSECLHYMYTYKELLLANVCYSLGLYVHNFVMWTVPGHSVAAKTFYTNQAYDMATYLAMMTNIFIMVVFTVSVETKFHTAYKAYMEAVLGGTYKMVSKGRKKLFRTLSQQMGQIFTTQMAITCVIYLLVISFGPSIGIDSVTLAIYPALVVAFLGIFMMYGNLVYLYYFSDLKGASLTGMIFFVITLIGSIISSGYDAPFWGVGVLAGMLAGWSYSFFRIRWIERNIDAYIFCGFKVVDTMKSSNKGKVIYVSTDGNAKE